MNMNELREKIGLELFSYHYMIDNPEKEVIVSIVDELININIPTLYGMNEKDTRIFRKSLGIYTDGISMKKEQISKEENQAINTINKKIKKGYELLKEYYIIKNTIFKINNYGMDKIDLFSIFQKSEDRYYFYYLNISSLQELINFGNDNLQKYFESRNANEQASYQRIVKMINILGLTSKFDKKNIIRTKNNKKG